MNNDFNILIQKVNGFIRKYYKNQMLKGLIYSLSILLVMFLLADGIEYLAWSDTLTRTILFYAFLSVGFFVLLYYLIIPGFKLISIGKTISTRQAAKIIGEHFPDVSDKLLNTLELQELSGQQANSNELQLLEASIEQRAAQLNPVPFKTAIDLKKNVRHLRYFVPPFLIIITILLISPAFITEPSKRIMNHSTSYEKPLPYQVSLLNQSLEVLQHEDFKVLVKAYGEEVPARINIHDGNFSYGMKESNSGAFEYMFNDVNQDIHFTILTKEYESKTYHIKVLPRPIIFSFDIELDYPDYLNMKNELVENSGDIVVPEGTMLKWNIFTKDTRSISFKTDEETLSLEQEEGNVFRYSKAARQNFYYTLIPANDFVRNNDSLTFSVQVIKDEYPSIDIGERKEETIYGFANYNGQINDDYGFRSLTMHYKKEGQTDDKWKADKLKIDRAVPAQHFNYSVQAADFELSPGESLSYYFEVRDNDAVNGFKRTRSSTFSLYIPDKDELEDNMEETSERIKDELKNAIKELDQVNKELEETKMSMFDKQELSWMDKKQLSELLKKEEDLQDKISLLNEMQQEISEIEDLLEKSTNEQLEERLDQLEEMFEEMENEDLLKQLEELKKELENLDKDELNKLLDNIKKENEQLKSNLEQNLEMYKQLEFEKKMQETVEKLNELAKEQKELSEKTAEKEIDEEKSLEEQEEIKEQFSEIEKDLEKAEELNKELEQPFDVETKPEESEGVKQEMSEASENLQKGKQKKAAENQNSAGEKMEQMAEQLSMAMQSAMESRMGEDVEMVKKLLDNLLDLSFSTERLMDEFKETSKNDPKYIDNIDQLKLLQDDFEIVNDSLIALSKRQMMVQPFIVKESGQVIAYMEKALRSMQDRKKGNALGEQQYAMTSMNNLALMLSESLENMKQSMQMMGKGGGQACPTPGMGNKPTSMKSMSKMQQQLNEGMEKGNSKDGQGGKDGVNGNSEELARMAATQGEIRRQLQEYMEKLESEGGNGGALNKLIEEMKKSEDDMVNRRITQETLERQKQIEVRLLKSEKAEQQREKEKKRESSEGKNRNRSNLTNQIEYKDRSTDQEEILITVPIEMSPYYKALLKKYLYQLEQVNDQQ